MKVKNRSESGPLVELVTLQLIFRANAGSATGEGIEIDAVQGKSDENGFAARLVARGESKVEDIERGHFVDVEGIAAGIVFKMDRGDGSVRSPMEVRLKRTAFSGGLRLISSPAG